MRSSERAPRSDPVPKSRASKPWQSQGPWARKLAKGRRKTAKNHAKTGLDGPHHGLRQVQVLARAALDLALRQRRVEAPGIEASQGQEGQPEGDRRLFEDDGRDEADLRALLTSLKMPFKAFRCHLSGPESLEIHGTRLSRCLRPLRKLLKRKLGPRRRARPGRRGLGPVSPHSPCRRVRQAFAPVGRAR